MAEPKRRHRSPGEGSYVRLKTGDRAGTWVGAATVELANGRKKRIYRRGPTQAVVKRKIAEALQQIKVGVDITSPSTLVKDYLDNWLEDVAKAQVRPQSYTVYKQRITHIIKGIGDQRLNRLRPEHLDRLYRDMLAAKLSPGYVKVAHSVLHQALALAYERGYVERNVADLARVPRAEEPEREALTTEQWLKVVEAAAKEESSTAALWLVLATTGVRLGEALGLQWDALDLDTGRLSVRRQLVRQTGELAETKTRSSRRPVPLMTVTVAGLRLHRERQDETARLLGWDPSGFVFRNPHGGPWSQDSARTRWHTFLRHNGMAKIHPHALRHTYTSLLLEHGASARTTADLLGHSTASETLNTYAHATPAILSDAVRRLEHLIDHDKAC